MKQIVVISGKACGKTKNVLKFFSYFLVFIILIFSLYHIGNAKKASFRKKPPYRKNVTKKTAYVQGEILVKYKYGVSNRHIKSLNSLKGFTVKNTFYSTYDKKDIIHRLRIKKGLSVAEAIAEYKKVLEIDPANKKVNYYLGQSYYAEGEYAEAIKVLEKASAEGPYFVDSLYYLGLTYQEIGETDKAIEVFQSALKIAPGREDIGKILLKIQH